MKILVTGATDGLGRNAVEYLRQQNIAVRATSNKAAMQPLLEKMGAEFIHADLTHLVSATAKRLLTDIDTVWHCSGFTSPWGEQHQFELANVRATRRLGEWATANGVKTFIHLSSPAIYFDYRHRKNVAESFRPLRYANEFARSKAAAEQIIEQLALTNPQTRFTILRPAGIFGPHDTVFFPRLLQMVRRYHAVLLPRKGAALVDMTYQENAIYAMWLATVAHHLPSGRAYNITNLQPRTLHSLIEQLLQALNLRCAIHSLPYQMLDLLARGSERLAQRQQHEPALTHYGVAKLNFDFTLDTQLAEQELHYRPLISLDEGIIRTANWLKDHGKFIYQ